MVAWIFFLALTEENSGGLNMVESRLVSLSVQFSVN
jgi:hypothetical protein